MTDESTPQRPTAAGIYDFLLGGTTHSPADQVAAERLAQMLPDIVDGALANRGFLQRAVKRLATDHGIRQFLDLGSGLPTQRNTHDVVAEVTPYGRVVYVDIDPVAVARSRQLLGDSDAVAAVEGDIRDPDGVLRHPETQRLIDFTQPVGLLMIALLHFIPDDDDPWGLVRRYLAALPSGSCLAISHASVDFLPEEARERLFKVYASTATPPTDRTKAEIARFLNGLEVVPPFPGADPGPAYLSVWGADDPDAADSDGGRFGYAAVGRKP